jgi:hypothetical protein
MRRLIFFCALLFLCPTAHAWSTKEHIQLTRIAAMELLADPATPQEMKDWLKEAAPGLMDWDGEKRYLLTKRMGVFPRGTDGLMFWAVVPDLEALTDKYNRKLPPLNVPERSMHFFDLEVYGPGAQQLSGESEKSADEPATASSNAAGSLVKPDPANKPSLADIPKNPKDPRLAASGALPYRVAQTYSELVSVIRDGRLVDKPGHYPRDQHAVHWAGFLAHYVQDSTQPQHSTQDYKSRSFFPPGTHVPDVHAILEYKLVDDDRNDYIALRQMYWPLFVSALKDAKELADSSDPWTATVQTCLISYDTLPLIGHAAVAAWDQTARPASPQDDGRIDVLKFYNFRGQAFGREMSVLELKAHQQAWAVKRTEAIWLAAWKEAKGEMPAIGERIGP